METDTSIDPILQQVAEHGKNIFQHIHATRGRYVKPIAPPESLIAEHNARLGSRSSVAGTLAQFLDNTYFVFQRSPPCYKPISSLKKADISNLKWCTVHRGRYVALRTLTRPCVSDANLGSLETIAEDERGMAITLRVFNVSLNEQGPDAERWIPEGAVIAVLEPYCEAVPEGNDFSGKKSSTLSGIRVDHPSDIIILHPGDELFPKSWFSRIEKDDANICERLKEEGNQAFKAKAYSTAITKYTEALHPKHTHLLKQSPSLHTSILLNLAQSQLLTQSFARAYVSASDAISLLTTSNANTTADETAQAQTSQSREKALFRSARASYALGRYGECIRTLEALLTPENSSRLVEAENLRKKAQQRLKERDEGKYDWVELVKDATTLDEDPSKIETYSTHDIDLADYGGPIEFKTSTDPNNSSHTPPTSLIASRTIQPGELLLACPAFSAIPTSHSSSTPSFIFDASTGEITLRESPPVVRALASRVAHKAHGMANLGKPGSKLGGVLRGGEAYQKVRVGGSGSVVDGREEAPVRCVEGRCVVDTNAIDSLLTTHATPFHPLHPLATSSPSSPSDLPPLLGLFPLPYIPHACLPNTVQSHLGTLLILRACRKIRKGEKITCARVHASLPIEERWQVVGGWERKVGGTLAQEGGAVRKSCSCDFCEIELNEGPLTRQKRVDIVQQVKHLAEHLPPSTLQSVSSSLPPKTPQTSPSSLTPPQSLTLSTLSTLTSLLTSLTATYTLPPTTHPRFALLEPLGYLSALHLSLPGEPHIESSIKANLEFLHSLGYEFTFSTAGGTGDGDILLARMGHPHPLALKTLVQQASICWQIGRKRAAEGWRKCAVQGVQVMGGPEGEGAEVLFRLWEGFGGVLNGVGWRS